MCVYVCACPCVCEREMSIITRKWYSVAQMNTSSTLTVLHYFANSLSQLLLCVVRLYLHCGISHWADI